MLDALFQGDLPELGQQVLGDWICCTCDGNVEHVWIVPFCFCCSGLEFVEKHSDVGFVDGEYCLELFSVRCVDSGASFGGIIY